MEVRLLSAALKSDLDNGMYDRRPQMGPPVFHVCPSRGESGACSFVPLAMAYTILLMASERSIYLDANATTRPLPEVLEKMNRVMTQIWANPSSIHRAGQMARREVDIAREEVCALINSRASEVIFTSGGTESVNTCLKSLARWRQKPVIITSAIEHAAVREQLEDLAALFDHEIMMLPNDSNGVVEIDAFAQVMNSRMDDIAFVTVMWANNETGVIQPVEQIGLMCREAGIPFHTDATQWVGKMPIDLESVCIDMVSFAGHKFHGPKGSGVLWLREGLPLHAMILGGGQERQRRGGTESVADIAGLGVACREARHWIEAHGHEQMFALRQQFEDLMQSHISECCINAVSAERIWSTSNIGFPGIEAELMLLGLSEAGVCASAGSACSSGALKGSSVIDAIGRQPCQVDERPYGSVRFSFDRAINQQQLESAVEISSEVFQRLAGLSPNAHWPLSAEV